MDEDSLKLLLAQGLSIEQIGRRYGRNASTVAYWMRKYGLKTGGRAWAEETARARAAGMLAITRKGTTHESGIASIPEAPLPIN